MPTATTRRRIQKGGPLPKHDPNVLRAYWLALPVERRSFRVVGERFGLSSERIGQIARRDGWAEPLAEREVELERREAAEYRQVVRRIARNRAERLERTLEVYDRANDLLLEKLPLTPAGELDVKALAADLPSLEALLQRIPRLFRMAELASGEATDRIDVSSVQPILAAFAKIAVVHAPVEARGEVYRELEQACGGLVELGLPGVAA